MANKYFPNLSDDKDIASVEPVKDGFNKVEVDVTELRTVMGDVADIYATKAETILIGDNLYRYSNDGDGYITSDGAIVRGSNGERTSDFIAITSEESYTFQAWTKIPDSGSVWMACCFYDSNRKKIGNRITTTTIQSEDNGVTYSYISFTCPADSSYVRVSARTYNNEYKFKVEEGTLKTPFCYAIRDVINSEDKAIASTLTPIMVASNAVSGKALPQFFSDTRHVYFPQDMLIYYRKDDITYSISTPSQSLSLNLSSSAVNVFFDILSKKFIARLYYDTPREYELLIATTRYIRDKIYPTIACPYTVDGKAYGVTMPEINYATRNINHRGYNRIAPENTLSAFKLSKGYGFEYVECDVLFTSDNIPVILHDDTIDRTSDGSGSIADMTFDTVRTYDFGSWKDPVYAGEKIPSFEEFMQLCNQLNLSAYVELKTAPSDEQAQILMEIVEDNNMKQRVSWISFSANALRAIREVDESARLVVVCGEVTATVVANAQSLKNNYNKVVIDAQYNTLTTEMVQTCKNENIPLEVWSPNNSDIIKSLDNYITGVTSDMLIASEVRGESSKGLADKEDIANKVTSITTGADDVKYPTAKAVKDYTDSSRKYDVIIDYTYNADETTAKLYIPVTEEQVNKIRRYEKFFSRVSYQVPADPNTSISFWAYTALALCSKSAPTTPMTYPILFMRAAHAGEKRTDDNQVWTWMASMEKLALPTTSGKNTYVSKVADYGGTIHKFQNVSSYYKLGHSHMESNMVDTAYTSYAWVIEISVPEGMPISKGMRFTLWGK